jgi:hypothetical protein
VARVVDRAPDLGDPAGHAGGRLVVHHADGPDGVAGVRAEPLGDHLGRDAVPPVAGHPVDPKAEVAGQFAPQGGEMAGLERQHPVARTQRVDQGGLPGAGARGRVDDDRAGGAEHPPQSLQNLHGQPGEIGSAVVYRGRRYRAEYPFRNIGRAWNLQKVPAGRVWHRQTPVGFPNA